MDPDELWKRITESAALLMVQLESGEGPSPILAEELASDVVDLQEWLEKGGFPPKVFTPQK